MDYSLVGNASDYGLSLVDCLYGSIAVTSLNGNEGLLDVGADHGTCAFVCTACFGVLKNTLLGGFDISQNKLLKMFMPARGGHRLRLLFQPCRKPAGSESGHYN